MNKNFETKRERESRRIVSARNHKLIYSPLRNCQREVFVNFLILLSDLDSFRIIFIEISNIASICCINFTLRRNERWRIILLINLLPIDTVKEGMVFDLNVEQREKTELKEILISVRARVKRSSSNSPRRHPCHNIPNACQRHVAAVHR